MDNTKNQKPFEPFKSNTQSQKKILEKVESMKLQADLALEAWKRCNNFVPEKLN